MPFALIVALLLVWLPLIAWTELRRAAAVPGRPALARTVRTRGEGER